MVTDARTTHSIYEGMEVRGKQDCVTENLPSYIIVRKEQFTSYIFMMITLNVSPDLTSVDAPDPFTCMSVCV